MSEDKVTVYLNGHIVTMDEENPAVEAMAIQGGAILSVGKTSVLKDACPRADDSDYPGEVLNPFYGMYFAETRRTADGAPREGWYPARCLNREESLRAYTVEAACAGFEEKIKGRIKPGMLADFIVVSDDVRRVKPEQLLSVRVLQTYVDGRLVYDSKTE